MQCRGGREANAMCELASPGLGRGRGRGVITWAGGHDRRDFWPDHLGRHALSVCDIYSGSLLPTYLTYAPVQMCTRVPDPLRHVL